MVSPTFKSEFGSKEFMIWATVSSWSSFCWLNRASPSLPAKNIINLILVLIIWLFSCVESSRVIGRVCLLQPVCSLGKTVGKNKTKQNKQTKKNRGTRDQIANTHCIILKTRECQKNTYFFFIKYTKPFDCVGHNTLWKILRDGNTRPP